MAKILMVDDSKAVHAFLRSAFAGTDVELTEVYDGQEAMALLTAHPHLIGGFDLILLDWEMPVLNGPATVDALQAKGVQTPILMMTTKNAPEDIMHMLQKGVSEYMLKPFTTDILFEKISFASGIEVRRVA